MGTSVGERGDAQVRLAGSIGHRESAHQARNLEVASQWKKGRMTRFGALR